VNVGIIQGSMNRMRTIHNELFVLFIIVLLIVVSIALLSLIVRPPYLGLIYCIRKTERLSH